MKTYIYKIQHFSLKRGYNRTVTVYRMKNNQPMFVGVDEHIDTASFKGDYAIACEIIAKNDSHQLTHCGYYLKSKNIKLREV